MAKERVTTNHDARAALLGNKQDMFDIRAQDLVIDKTPDAKIFDAVERANGYGRRYIKYLREKQKKAAIPGLFLALTWGTAIIVALAFTYGGVGWGHTVSRYKTPDGRHTIYYTSDEIIGSGYKDCYRRTGFLTYEYIFTAEDLDKDVTWGSGSITYHGDEYKYSTYGE